MPDTVIGHIARLLQAEHNCRKRAEEPLGGDAERWARRHSSAISDIISNHLPHGSGFDSGVSLGEVKRDDFGLPTSIQFVCPYHVMNEGGYYVGWAEYIVTVTPEFGGIGIDIERTESTGDDAEEGLDDHIAETMHDSLTAIMERVPSEYYADV